MRLAAVVENDRVKRCGGGFQVAIATSTKRLPGLTSAVCLVPSILLYKTIGNVGVSCAMLAITQTIRACNWTEGLAITKNRPSQLERDKIANGSGLHLHWLRLLVARGAVSVECQQGRSSSDHLKRRAVFLCLKRCIRVAIMAT